jgi:hypothetical protein
MHYLSLIARDCADRRQKGYLLSAVVQILADGKPKSASELLKEGQRRGTLPSSIVAQYVYVSLILYMRRFLSRARRSPIIQDPDHRFRLNHPLDDWPLEPPASDDCAAARPIDPTTASLIARLRSTAVGMDSEGFEATVCDCLAALGFIPKHMGGNDAPDGYADAPLGRLGYRVMIECKTSKPNGIVNNPIVFEAAKYRSAFGAQHCLIIGNAFGDTTMLDNELKTHDVSLWTVDDLAKVMELRVNLFALRRTFAGGRAADALWDLLWDLQRGDANRVRVVSRYICEEGWKAQEMAASEVPPTEAPLLNLDAAMMLVDERLEREGCTVGCKRAEAEAAFAWLTNPRVGLATAVDGSAAIVLIRPARETLARLHFMKNEVVALGIPSES